MAAVIVNPRKHFAGLLLAMQEAGGRMSAAQVREALGQQDKSNLARRLRPAIDAGLIERTGSGWRSAFALCEGVDLTNLEQEQEQPAVQFEPALYGDGTLVLTGCPLDTDGDPCLSRAQAARVKALLNGSVV